jgi:prepilin-type N-terminal cleavage/methylation domain-containing protein
MHRASNRRQVTPPSPAGRGAGGEGDRRSSNDRRACWRGFTMLELTVAMLILGIAISGIFPLVVSYSRVLESLEKRPNWLCFNPTANTELAYREGHPDQWYHVPDSPPQSNSGEWVHRWYLVPYSNPWERKLGAAAVVKDTDPGPKPVPPVPTPPGLVADDEDPGYSDVGGDWITDTGVGFQNDRRRHAHVVGLPAPDNSEMAVWTFTNVPAGWYRVQATWTAASDQVTDASYTLYDGATLLADFPVGAVNQQATPNGADGWQTLQTAYFEQGTVSVKLSALSALTPNNYVSADGMRLVLVENLVQIDCLQRSAANDAEMVTARVKADPPD